MSKLTLKEILEIPELSFYINPSEFINFFDRLKDAQSAFDLYNENCINFINGLTEKKIKASDEVNELTQKIGQLLVKKRAEIERIKKEAEEKKEDAAKTEIRIEETEANYEAARQIILKQIEKKQRVYSPMNSSDSFASRSYSDEVKSILLQYHKKYNKDKLLLYLGGLCAKYLKDIEVPGKYTEIVYANGDIVKIKNGKAFRESCEQERCGEIPLEEIRASLIKGVFLVNKEFADILKRNKSFGIKGKYVCRGVSATEESFSISVDELNEFAKSGYVLKYLSIDQIEELLRNKMLTISDIFRASTQKSISKADMLEFMHSGVLKKEEVLRRVFGVNDFRKVLEDKNTSIEIKLMLYSMGLTDIKTLEKNADKSKDRDSKEISAQYFERISKYYDKKKIGELLTHNVLSYRESMEFLRVLTEKEVITPNESQELEKVMNDFKCNELLNNIPSEPLDITHIEGTRIRNMPSLGIDPKLRLEYLKSIGAVKRIPIKGEVLDGEEFSTNDRENPKNGSKKSKNSLDGYEILIIPDKRVAVLEKFYEPARDENGNIVYRKDKTGKLIPSVENATYVLPIGLAKDLVETRNKKELIKHPRVRRAFHVMNWTEQVEQKIRLINPEVKFKEDSTEYWKKRIADNYEKNKRKQEEK